MFLKNFRARQLSCLLWLCLQAFTLPAQSEYKQYNVQHFEFRYKDIPADFLVISQRGAEKMPRPLLLFCQGSLPQPLIKWDDEGPYEIFPFLPDALLKDYHIAIVGKPFVPLKASVAELNPNFTWLAPAGQDSLFTRYNNLDFYVDRNLAIINRLRDEPFITKNRLVVAGHSEGSTIAAAMAAATADITHLIYSGGNTSGRLMSLISQSAGNTQPVAGSSETYKRDWEYLLKKNRQGTLTIAENSFFSLSVASKKFLQRLQIPVLITYGTRDPGALFNDAFHLDCLDQDKQNIQFYSYPGRDHNYEILGEIGQPVMGWDMVAEHWCAWLRAH